MSEKGGRDVPEPLFPALVEAVEATEDDHPAPTIIESLCMNCHNNGETRLLLTRIPHYKQVVIMSFSCPHCGFSNNELQQGANYPDRAVRYTLEVREATDLDRQVVKSDHCSITIPQLDLEIPPNTQRAEITTVEGVLVRAAEGLGTGQAERLEQRPEQAKVIQRVVDKLSALLDREHFTAFTFILDDISGNSWIENPLAPSADAACRCERYARTPAQDHALGIFSQRELCDDPPPPQTDTVAPGVLSRAGGAAGEGRAEGGYDQLVSEEVLTFPTNCCLCGAAADTRMKLTKIPHFKEVVIMATNCDACGHRTNEVKSGGGIEPEGVRIELRVSGPQDFSRDVLKSETCSLEIPELSLEVGGAALGGRFTTTEGLLRATADQLESAPHLGGDSVQPERAARMRELVQQIERVLRGERSVTLVLDDPAGNSYVQSVRDTCDTNLTVTRYERNFEQNEELGLNDMKTENYQEDT